MRSTQWSECTTTSRAVTRRTVAWRPAVDDLPLLNPPEFPDCFVCGAGKPRGAGPSHPPRRHRRGGALHARTPTHIGYPDRVHGGLIGMLVDEMLGLRRRAARAVGDDGQGALLAAAPDPGGPGADAARPAGAAQRARASARWSRCTSPDGTLAAEGEGMCVIRPGAPPAAGASLGRPWRSASRARADAVHDERRQHHPLAARPLERAGGPPEPGRGHDRGRRDHRAPPPPRERGDLLPGGGRRRDGDRRRARRVAAGDAILIPPGRLAPDHRGRGGAGAPAVRLRAALDRRGHLLPEPATRPTMRA